MWTSKNRGRYDRSKLRYPSDLTDDELKLVEHLIPPGKPGGGKRTVIMREVVNGLMYVLSTGCERRTLPKSTTSSDDTGQGLLDFYRPPTLREKLAALADAPMQPRRFRRRSQYKPH